MEAQVDQTLKANIMGNRVVSVKVEMMEHFDRELPLPHYATAQSAGADIRVSLKDKGEITIKAGERKLLPTGLKLEIPPGYEVQVRPRSGLSLKTDLLVVNSPGTIDADYRGEVMVIMGNMGSSDIVINHGERIAQLVIAPVWQINWEQSSESLSETDRGAGGFGHTGIN